MKQQSFQLVIQPGFEGAVRFAQLYSYAENERAGEVAIIAPALLDYMRVRFNDHDPSITIQNLIDNKLNGWRIETTPSYDKHSLAIVSEDAGIRLSNLLELIEWFLPEALGQKIVYEPVEYRRPSQYDFYLH